jgi:hypothetical protein
MTVTFCSAHPFLRTPCTAPEPDKGVRGCRSCLACCLSRVPCTDEIFEQGVSRQSTLVVGLAKSVTDATLEFRMRPVNYGLYNTLVLSCGAASSPQEGPVPAEKSARWSFAIAFWSNLPVDLPARSTEVDLAGHLLHKGCRLTCDVTSNSRAPPQVCHWPAEHCPATLSTGGCASGMAVSAGNVVSLMQVRVADAQGQVSCVPAHASRAPAPEQGTTSQDAFVIRPEIWTHVWASGVAFGAEPLRVTDVVLRMGSDTAFVWTLANFPAGRLHALSFHALKQRCHTLALVAL